MRSSGRLVVVGAVLGVVADSAAAPAVEPPPPDNPRAARAVATWRKLGARRAEMVARAYCATEDRPVRQAAEQELRALGVAAVEPLIGQDGPGCNVGMLASEILCGNSCGSRTGVTYVIICERIASMNGPWTDVHTTSRRRLGLQILYIPRAASQRPCTKIQ